MRRSRPVRARSPAGAAPRGRAELVEQQVDQPAHSGFEHGVMPPTKTADTTWSRKCHRRSMQVLDGLPFPSATMPLRVPMACRASTRCRHLFRSSRCWTTAPAGRRPDVLRGAGPRGPRRRQTGQRTGRERRCAHSEDMIEPAHAQIGIDRDEALPVSGRSVERSQRGAAAAPSPSRISSPPTRRGRPVEDRSTGLDRGDRGAGHHLCPGFLEEVRSLAPKDG